MRWSVRVSPVGDDASCETYCVEGQHWQYALQQVRDLGSDGPFLSGLLVEVLHNGCRVVDPVLKTSYSVARAPDDEPLRGLASGSALASDAGTATPVADSAALGRHDSRPVHSAAGAPGSSPARPAPVAEPSLTAAEPPDFWLIHRREQDRTAETPITYREYAYAVDGAGAVERAEALLWIRFREVCASIARQPPGKFVQLAVFDHFFDLHPLRPPVATLVWKDWRGDPVVQFPAGAGGWQKATLSYPPPGVVSGPATLELGTFRSQAELFAELEEALNKLPGQANALSGAELVRDALLRTLPNAALLIHFFDLSTNEFVVVCASGRSSARALSMRTLERQPPLSLLAGRQSPQRLKVAQSAELVGADRWQMLGIRPAYWLGGLLRDRRRLLGAIELAYPAQVGDFVDAEVAALAYVCERFAEFLAERPLEFKAVVVADA